MSGYFGYSMSNNAITAYSNGEKPISKWTKTAILEAITAEIEEENLPSELFQDAQKLTAKQLKMFLRQSSWHHTSKHYNRTIFYSLDTDALLDYFGYTSAISGQHNGETVIGDWTGERDESGYLSYMQTIDGRLIPSKEITNRKIVYIKETL